ncbi:hypothetical protein CLU96_2390 [Chryseobacterium sp. 52]|uniref:hypothetical protein n=1 Tax=Chryseobacterium sp. 52 TaxID=2035213 RepID=UPI000C5DD7FF|nr:hypothetical protein [Chryseobacterium sp. 52]PIF45386.1 hypothetical protein CLU96_2390 [Chryseobacterium sp. 52]
MEFYLIRNKKAPWGDYGNVLLYGFISKEVNEIVVERVGPFIPAIYSYNKYIAVIDSIKDEIEESHLNGVKFIKSKKKKIVKIDWQNWSTDEKIPEKPKSGEPEDFIFKGKNDEVLIHATENIWVISPGDTAKGIIDKDKKVVGEYNHISLNISDWNGDDVFRTPELGHVFCTENFKNTIDNKIDSYLTFIPISLK